MRISALQTGTVAVKEAQREGRGSGPARIVNVLRGKQWTEPLPIHVWVIEHPEGVIVVDTGETARVMEPGWFPRWNPYFRNAVRFSVRPDQEIGPQLEHIGVSPQRVRWVVITHMHTDHAGGLPAFPQAEILVTQAELDASSGVSGRINGYLPQHRPDWFAPRVVEWDSEPWGPFPASMPLTSAGDVRLVPTPGHTPGHMSVVVQEAEGPLIFFAGDTSYTQELMRRGAVDGVSADPAAAAETLRRIHDLCAAGDVVYLPTHDPESARRLASRSPVPRS
ncbi:MAG: N-acyl homoserine lactonase family protein [Thermoleophilaceae bacterium]|nr:N-acyl homoserine lactonase family protein [Thermoleophilaceae bacterium]